MEFRTAYACALLLLLLRAPGAGAAPWAPVCAPHVSVPHGVEVVPARALQGCALLRTLTLAKTTKIIQEQALQGCANLTSVRNVTSLRYVGAAAFESCDSLEALRLPETVEYIGFNAFASTPLTPESTPIPAAVTKLNDFFGNCPASASTVAGASPSSYDVPAQYTSIGSDAFSQCPPTLTAVHVGHNVTDLDLSAFGGAASLTSVTLPPTPLTIGASAFEGCAALTSISLPSGLTRIEDDTFHGCAALRVVSVPDSVTFVSDTAFSGCSAQLLRCELRCPAGQSVLNVHTRKENSRQVDGIRGCTTAVLSNLTCGTPAHGSDGGGGGGFAHMLAACGIGAGAVALCLGVVVLRGRRLERQTARGAGQGLLPRNSNSWRRRGSAQNPARAASANAANIMGLFAALALIAPAAMAASASSSCVHIRSPSSDYDENTRRIQAALDDPRGCAVIWPGDYPVLSLKVGSNTHLRIAPEARLVNVINKTRTAVVHILDATNVTLDGGGTIYGNAENAWRYFSDVDDRMSPYFDDGGPFRANTLLVENSDLVVVRDVRLHNSTDWTFRMQNSSNIYVDNVDIYGDSRFPNNDGFDPMSCRNVTLVNSRISVADDGICPKASAGMGPLLNLFVQNVTVRSKSHAIKFGSNTDTLMANIVFDNITIWDSNGGMSIQQRSEGDIRNVTFSNILTETRYQAPRWWGNGEWITISNNPRGDGHTIGTVSGIRFVNISGRSENGALVSGLGSTVNDVAFQNINMRFAAWSNYSTGSGPPCYADGPVCSNATGKGVPSPSGPVKCAEHDVKTDTKLAHCMGSRDYRPTPGSDHLTGDHGFYARLPGKADAVFLENAHGVTFENVTFTYATPREAWFGKCLVVDEYSSGVVGADGIVCVNGEGTE